MYQGASFLPLDNTGIIWQTKMHMIRCISARKVGTRYTTESSITIVRHNQILLSVQYLVRITLHHTRDSTAREKGDQATQPDLILMPNNGTVAIKLNNGVKPAW